jgi:histidyl-tRNA synthetase
MADKPKKPQKLKARLPRGLEDRGPAAIAATRQMVEKIREVYERYGFEPVETPAMEFTDALGKFLPDQDRPNEGVFSFQDDDEQWISLRYDLTAPLARYVAENFDSLPKPYRSYRAGYVYRNEKPGPGRFRQFMQFDADTVGSPTMAADAEICMMAADTMEALGIPRGQYIVKVNNRKVLDGVMESIGVTDEKKLTVLRALDKYDRLGVTGVRRLLGEGRTDESGDFTKGAELPSAFISTVIAYVEGASEKKLFEQLLPILMSHHQQLSKILTPQVPAAEAKPTLTKDQLDQLMAFYEEPERRIFKSFERFLGDDKVVDVHVGQEKLPMPVTNASVIERLRSSVIRTPSYLEGVDELEKIAELVFTSGYGTNRIIIDPSVVRGLEYYTGPVYEVELTLETKDEKGRTVRFGSVGGGGRYDGLVSRFRGEPVPATGFSIGVSRLLAALTMLGKLDTKPAFGPVVVTVFGGEIADYQKMVATLRKANIRAELYLGNPKHSLGQQMKYADRRNAPCAIVQGSDEKANGKVQIKDLILGARLTETKDREEYLKKQSEAQYEVDQSKLVEAVREVLARHDVSWG